MLLNEAEQLLHFGTWQYIIASQEFIWSNGLYAMFGYAPNELELNVDTILNIIHPDDRASALALFQTTIESRQPYSTITRYIHKSGQIVHVQSTGKLVYDEAGNLTQILGIIQDITEQRKLQTLLDESNELAQIGSFEIDVINNKVYWSPITKKIREVPPDYEPDLQTGISYFNGEKNQSVIAQRVYNCIQKGTPWDEELEIITHKGNPKWVRTIGRGEFENGKCIRVFGSFQDIDARKRTELELLKLYEERNTILESIGDGFFAVNTKWEVTYWNRMAEQLLQVKKENIIGKNLWTVFKNYQHSDSWKYYHQAMAEKVSFHFKDFYHELQKWFDISVYPTPIGLSVYFRNITQEKIAEQAIVESNERYDLLAKATNDCIWDWDLKKNTVTRPGKILEQLLGYEPLKPEEVDPFWATHVHPEDWKRISDDRAELYKNPNANFWEDEYRIIKSDGTYAIIYDRGYIIRDKNGKAIRIIGASRDVTREKQHTNEIKRIQRNLHALINATDDFIWSVDVHLNLIAANSAFANYVENITGSPINEGEYILKAAFDRNQLAKWEMYYHRALMGESFNFEESFTDTNGNVSHNLVTLNPIKSSSGEITGVACYAKNITEVKKVGIQLQLLNDDLKKQTLALAASNAELEQFAYVASHDLQEPLRMVTSFLTQLEKKYSKQLDEQAKIYIHFAVDGATRMRQIILDLLAYSRVGRIHDKAENIAIKDVVEEIKLLYQQQIQQKQATIQYNNLPQLFLPKAPVRQVFLNLIQNALKYSKINQPPIIQINATHQNNEWQFSVQDNGIGIDQEYFQQIFVIFQRLHSKDEYGGSGIGLAITKKIIENFGGKIWVTSQPDVGSTFYFTFPNSLNEY
jgi:PAS domain S-box-containing protein